MFTIPAVVSWMPQLERLSLIKQKDNKCWPGCGGRVILHTVGGSVTTMEISGGWSTKSKTRANTWCLYHSWAFSWRTCTLQRCSLAHILCCLFTIAQKHNQPRSPLTDEWIMKMLYTYMMKLYSSIKNEIYRRMDGTGKYTEWVIQAQEGKHCMHVLSQFPDWCV